jgi:hypothetical protein
MKKCMCIFMFLHCFCGESYSQAQELQQLSLDIEKLAQLKSMLSSMTKGYSTIKNGYNSVIGISQSNFDLHKTFLDGLFQVSPAVKRYKKINDIISDQSLLVKEYKTANDRFRSASVINPKELLSISNKYAAWVEQSEMNLDELLLVITPGQLRMSDEERIAVIDRADSEMKDILNSLRMFNNSNNAIMQNRQRVKKDIEVSRQIFGLK